MEMETNRTFGQVITRLINKENLSEAESYDAFCSVLNNEVTDMQQGAFLAALTAKGETAQEVVGGWQALYEMDTNKVDLSELNVVDNCGTGMDSFKTFNISTAASLVAATAGIPIARHGARAISSSCGTVDMAEMLGVDVECGVEFVEKSVRKAGIGLFNGMSPEVHPMALGRILSQISFGSPLNIAASLAHPGLPRFAVRGVYSEDLLIPVAQVMNQIMYRRALVIFGQIEGSEKGIDEASVCGKTSVVELKNGEYSSYTFSPEDFGLSVHAPEEIAADVSAEVAVDNMYRLLAGRGSKARRDVTALNAGLILYVAGNAETLGTGITEAMRILQSGKVVDTVRTWVGVQSRNPEASLEHFAAIEKRNEGNE